MRSISPSVGSSPRLRKIALVATPLDELRETVAALPSAPPSMAGYLDKVRTAAHAIVDEDVEALKAAGCSEDEIFEQTVAAAVGEGLRRLDAGLRAVG
jgi:alkylhydroperoxidase family enzyme